MDFSIATSEQMHALGKRIGQILVARDVICLDGPLGAGKTTFTQGLAEGLGVLGLVTSPTYVVSRIHKPATYGPILVHVDAYRLADARDLEDLDLAQHGDFVLVMEWGKSFADELGDEWLLIEIDRGSDALDESDPAGGERKVTMTGYGPRWSNLDQLLSTS